MTMNLEMISKELIKPSSPTPSHLRKLKLSFIDQIAAAVHVPIILFYLPENITSTANHSHSLKISLSEILTRFYPLAGRLHKDGLSIDCNDAGVEYVEARVEGELSQIVNNPQIEELGKFIWLSQAENMVCEPLRIQVNYFRRGGVAVAVSVLHKMADCFSCVSFLNSWANQSLGTYELIENPDFSSGYNLFQPIDLSYIYRVKKEEQIVTKRFVFDKLIISKLKQEMMSENISPTRVEAVSAFIWKHLMMTKDNENEKKLYVASHVVNLRTRMEPPLEGLAFGNICFLVFTSPLSSGDYKRLVSEFRDAISKINNERYCMDNYVKTEYSKNIFGEGNIEIFFFSSWIRFPYYEVDFGWGKPVWVSIAKLPMKNSVTLMRTRDGDGIEAWVSMREADVVALAEAIQNLM